jgi:hypothetical protein
MTLLTQREAALALTEPDMTKKLKEVLGCQHKKNPEGTKRAWAFPALSECRERFEQYMHSHWNWDADVTEWQYEGQSLLDRPVRSIR